MQILAEIEENYFQTQLTSRTRLLRDRLARIKHGKTITLFIMHANILFNKFKIDFNCNGSFVGHHRITFGPFLGPEKIKATRLAQ